MFVDRARIRVRGGNGGSGCLSFRREKFVPKGGPDGGDGGKGGDVILQTEASLTTLLDFKNRPTFRAGRAEHGQGANKHGRGGTDLIVKIPPGTVVMDLNSGEILADFIKNGQTLVVARGGRGGRGNARFASSTNQAPRRWEKGEYGEERTLALELKVIADVGLVGLPNAGKSTLLSKLSAATPKVADYPFTTLTPNLGVVRYRETSGFVMADVPGLIEGAHMGKGLGLDFLRHIERTRVIVILLDCSSEGLTEDYRTLLAELKSYKVDLTKRERIVALTKLDLFPEGRPALHDFISSLDEDVCQISSLTGLGLTKLKDLLWRKLQALPTTSQMQNAK